MKQMDTPHSVRNNNNNNNHSSTSSSNYYDPHTSLTQLLDLHQNGDLDGVLAAVMKSSAIIGKKRKTCAVGCVTKQQSSSRSNVVFDTSTTKPSTATSTIIHIQNETTTKQHIPKKRKRVHFGVAQSSSGAAASFLSAIDTDSPVQEEVIEFESTSIINNDRNDIWWDIETIHENKRQMKEYQRMATAADNQKGELYKTLSFFMMSYRSHCSEELKCNLQKMNSMYDTVRGFERYAVPKLQMHRMMSCQAVLQLQKELKQCHRTVHGGSNKDYYSTNDNNDDAALLLRRKSIQLSRASRQLAFRLAQCDHYQANQIYKEC